MGMVSTLASASSLFVNLSVVWVALLSPVALKERLSGKKVAGVMVSLLGVVLMTTNLDFTSLDTADIMGNFLVVSVVVLLTETIVLPWRFPALSSEKSQRSSLASAPFSS